jgi:hypothetical protein
MNRTFTNSPSSKVTFRPTACWLGLSLLSLLLCSSGCQSLTTTKQWNWPWDSKNKDPQVPDRILPIWTDTIMHQPGKPGIRGFGGRVYFYAGEESQAIEVDGGLVVYVFDSDKMDPHSPSPEKKYVFTPEHMKNHMSEAPLGKSYSIWLPWDEVGGESRSLTLVARFEGTKGGVVLSQPAVKFLPGVAKKENLAKTQTDSDSSSAEIKTANGSTGDASSVQQAGYQDSADRIRWTDPKEKSAAKDQAKRRETQTIDLPPSFYRHLTAPPGSPLSDPFQDASPNSTPSTTSEGSSDTSVSSNTTPTSRSSSTAPETSSSTPGADTPPTLNPLLRYPFRHVPGAEETTTTGSMETTISKTRPNRREPMKGGWIEGLPKTPRTP